jgi:hypothetical protein
MNLHASQTLGSVYFQLGCSIFFFFFTPWTKERHQDTRVGEEAAYSSISMCDFTQRLCSWADRICVQELGGWKSTRRRWQKHVVGTTSLQDAVPRRTTTSLFSGHVVDGDWVLGAGARKGVITTAIGRKINHIHSACAGGCLASSPCFRLSVFTKNIEYEYIFQNMYSSRTYLCGLCNRYI